MGTVANCASPEDYLVKPGDFQKYYKVPCFIYVIQWGEDGPVKIGQAVDPFFRRRELQTANWNTLYLIAAVPIIGPANPIEKLTHRTAVEHLLMGEWFDMPPLEAVGYILSAADQCGQTVYPLEETLRIIEENRRLAFRAKMEVEDQKHWRAVGWID